MSMLSAPRLHKLIEEGVIDALHENINSGSIDIRIGNKILVEKSNFSQPGHVIAINPVPVDVNAKQSPEFIEVEIPEEGYIIEPGQAILACSMETFNLPNTISAMFKLRSSMGRCFLNHMMAGWADAGWHGAQLTMEFVNQTQYHRLLIKPGMRVGQMVFFEHEDAGEDSYSVKGNYNNQQGPTVAFAGQVVEIKS
ncbi:MAG: dCTP deaminase [Bacteroidales bacterium]